MHPCVRTFLSSLFLSACPSLLLSEIFSHKICVYKYLCKALLSEENPDQDTSKSFQLQSSFTANYFRPSVNSYFLNHIIGCKIMQSILHIYKILIQTDQRVQEHFSSRKKKKSNVFCFANTSLIFSQMSLLLVGSNSNLYGRWMPGDVNSSFGSMCVFCVQCVTISARGIQS